MKRVNRVSKAVLLSPMSWQGGGSYSLDPSLACLYRLTPLFAPQYAQKEWSGSCRADDWVVRPTVTLIPPPCQLNNGEWILNNDKKRETEQHRKGNTRRGLFVFVCSSVSSCCSFFLFFLDHEQSPAISFFKVWLYWKFWNCWRIRRRLPEIVLTFSSGKHKKTYPRRRLHTEGQRLATGCTKFGCESAHLPRFW